MRGKTGWAGAISGDIRIVSVGPLGGPLKKTHTLRPGQVAIATVRPKIKLPFLHIPDISTRSIVARHGVQAYFHEAQVGEILERSETPDQVGLNHLGAIPIRLRKGNRLHRVYLPMLPRVGREEILARKKKGDLVFGNDFSILPNGVVEIKIRPVVYELKTDPKVVARTNWVSGSKRKRFMAHFERKRKPVRTKFEQVVLTETKYVKLPKDIGFLIQPTMEDHGTNYHIKSMLIDPGFEGPIVLEIFGAKEGEKPDRIIGRFVRPPN